MLSGLEAIELKFSVAAADNNSFRFDSEFWKKEYVANDKWLSEHGAGRLRESLKEITGGATPLGAVYPDVGLPFLRVQNVMQNYINDSDLAFISESDHRELKRSELKAGDVLLTITGVSYGKSAVVPPRFVGSNINQHSVRMRVNQRHLLPHFLSTFLNCKYGKLQSDRNIVGVTRPALDYATIANFKIPRPSIEFQKAVQGIILKAAADFELSRQLTITTNQILFAALGLNEWQPNDDLACARSATDVFGSGRLDAEYFRPRYQSLLALLRRQGKTLRDVARLREVIFTPRAGRPFHYIEIGNLAVDGAATSYIVPGEEAPSRAKWIVQPGDVITSTVRPNRCLTGLIESEQAGNVCSSGFAALNPRSIPSELLFAYLRLPVICELMDLHTTASMYPAISTTDLMGLPFLFPDDATISKVKQQITASRAARREAAARLEKAKLAVEMAIEKNESAGLAELSGHM
ncbi:MAG: type restriction/modification system methyltransferase [Verrucomicrobiales bacterium]|nr:type restriction/modification system methyltransferase [Verrucomicrobiales bacterium]